MGDFISLSHRLAPLLGGNLGKMMEAKSMAEQQRLFDRHIAHLFDHWLIRWACRQPAALYSLGIPPNQYEAIERDSAGAVHHEMRARMRRLACDFPISENCFAQQAFGRRYDTSRQSALPMYLQRRHQDAIRKNLGKLHLHHTSLTDFLANRPANSLDAYVFLDAQDWMDADQLTSLWAEVNRTARPGARVLFRTGGHGSPLERMLPAEWLANWRTDVDANREMFKRDRSAIYGGMHLYTRA